MLLERAARITGWFSPGQVKGSRAELAQLAREGYLEGYVNSKQNVPYYRLPTQRADKAPTT